MSDGVDVTDHGAPGVLEALWRYRWSSLLIIVLITLIAGGASYALAPKATAESTIGLTTPSSTNVLVQGSQGDASLSRYASQRALFAVSDEVLGEAADRLAVPITDLRKRVTVTPGDTSTSMTVVATAQDRQSAVDTVTAVVTAYRNQTSKQVADRTDAALATIDAASKELQSSLSGDADQARAQAAAATLSQLRQQASALQTDSAVFGDGVEFVQAATIDNAVGRPIPVTTLALGLLVGAGVATVIAWLRADSNRRISRSEQAEEVLEGPELGDLPVLPKSGSVNVLRTEAARACREVLVPLLQQDKLQVLLVTATQGRAGTTTVAVGLATAAASEGLRVLAVDADSARGGGMAPLLGLGAGTMGLLETASDASVALDTFLVQSSVSHGGEVHVLPYGSAYRSDADVTTAGLNRLVAMARQEFDLVVIDAPMAATQYVSSALAGAADGILVVVPQGTMVAPLQALARHLTLMRAEIVGFVYNTAGSGRRR